MTVGGKVMQGREMGCQCSLLSGLFPGDTILNGEW